METNLKHTALYAKNWYKKSDNVVEDLFKTMKADGYAPFNKYDVFRLLLSAYEKIEYKGYSQLQNIVEGVSPDNVWKVGYYTKDNCPYLTSLSKEEHQKLPEYDYVTAVIMFILSYLCMCEVEQLGGLPKPDKKVLPLRKD